MDIMIHIGLILIIGIFFFLDKFSKTNNSMFIVILLTFFGFIFLMADPNIELVDYTNTTLDSINTNLTYEYYDRIDISSNGLGLFNVLSFLVLVYMFFLIVAVTNFTYDNKKYGK